MKKQDIRERIMDVVNTFTQEYNLNDTSLCEDGQTGFHGRLEVGQMHPVVGRLEALFTSELDKARAEELIGVLQSGWVDYEFEKEVDRRIAELKQSNEEDDDVY